MPPPEKKDAPADAAPPVLTLPKKEPLPPRPPAVAVDLTEQIAGKTALQEATAAIAERLLPKLAKEKED